ncbi:MAG TPA: M4 family metallopeptidase [Gemmatimonadales bacterium]
MNRPRLCCAPSYLVSAFTLLALGSCSPVPRPVSIAVLAQAAQAEIAVNYNPFTGRPSFMRGRIPRGLSQVPATDTTPAVAYGFMRRYADLFGIDSTGKDLRVLDSRIDALGMHRVVLQQVYEGVDVYGAVYSIHVARGGEAIVAMSSNLVPGVRVPSVQPAISRDSARAVARSQLARGEARETRLVVYPGPRRASRAILAWVVEVRGDSLRRRATRTDTIPARHDFVIDAGSGRILDVLDRLYTARDRRTHDAGHGTSLPGTLRRAEGAGPVGDADVDSAHTFLGNTYDYFAGTHTRDSYDNAGAALVSSVHYSVNYQNAFWDGTQMVFGDGFAVKDVTAHELTHAVTERTANLEYRWQSGALNESFSDIFGAMVDRDDWRMGEDLPIGAIRDMENPGAFNQPGHASNWVATCSDNEGVHTNSGIPSKAFVNVAGSIGKGDTERIFYRALTAYLHPQSTLEDARAAALQAAEDLFGPASTQAQAVTSGFNAVGLNGSFQPPANSCSPFPTPADLSPLAALVLAILLALAMAWRARRTRAAGV